MASQARFAALFPTDRRAWQQQDRHRRAAGASIGGDAKVGGDLVGHDQVTHGDQVRGNKITNIFTGIAPTPEAPLVEEKIRLDVAAPPSAELEVPFDLAVAVRQADAPVLAVEDLTQLKSEEGNSSDTTRTRWCSTASR
jgi:hypothetical protein